MEENRQYSRWRYSQTFLILIVILACAGKEALAATKEHAANAAKETMELTKYEYEKVSERLLIEYESFKSRKVADIKEIILNFVSLQIEFHKKAEEAWTELLPKIEAIAVQENTAGVRAVRPTKYTSFNNPSTTGSEFGGDGGVTPSHAEYRYNLTTCSNPLH